MGDGRTSVYASTFSPQRGERAVCSFGKTPGWASGYVVVAHDSVQTATHCTMPISQLLPSATQTSNHGNLATGLPSFMLVSRKDET